MITIQSGKLVIPEEERFVGFAGDNLSSTRQFLYPNRAADGCTYTLYLKFDDDSVRSVALDKAASGVDLVLTWNIAAEHILRPGIVMAQIKCEDPRGVVTHTGSDFFVVARSAEHDDEGVEVEHITRTEYESGMSDLRSDIQNSMPYIGEDGYWYLYDPTQDAYERSSYTATGVIVDSAVSPTSANPVENRAVKSYVDTAVAGRVSTNTQIAGLPLSGDIEASQLVGMIINRICPPLLGYDSFGYTGQFGRTAYGDPVMCEEMGVWIKLAKQEELNAKMAYAPVVHSADIAGLHSGQVFVYNGAVALKNSTGYTELASKAGVYSKSEINAMVGDIAAALAQV